MAGAAARRRREEWWKEGKRGDGDDMKIRIEFHPRTRVPEPREDRGMEMPQVVFSIESRLRIGNSVRIGWNLLIPSFSSLPIV